MLTEPEREISVIADALALSVKDVLAAISALTDLSLLQASPDSPDAFRPVSPHLAFQTIVRRREANLARSQDELAAVQAAIAIAAAYQQPIAPDRTEHLSAPEVVQARLDTLAAHTATEWLVVLTGASQPIGMSLSLSLDHCMTDRGVQVLILLQDSLRKDTAVFGHALWSIKMAGKPVPHRCCPLKCSSVTGESPSFLSTIQIRPTAHPHTGAQRRRGPDRGIQPGMGVRAAALRAYRA